MSDNWFQDLCGAIVLGAAALFLGAFVGEPILQWASVEWGVPAVEGFWGTILGMVTVMVLMFVVYLPFGCLLINGMTSAASNGLDPKNRREYPR